VAVRASRAVSAVARAIRVARRERVSEGRGERFSAAVLFEINARRPMIRVANGEWHAIATPFLTSERATQLSPKRPQRSGLRNFRRVQGDLPAPIDGCTPISVGRVRLLPARYIKFGEESLKLAVREPVPGAIRLIRRPGTRFILVGRDA
jgi:hypothetical protein